MPTKSEREYYRAGYQDGVTDARRELPPPETLGMSRRIGQRYEIRGGAKSVKKRKLSDWQKYVKLNSKFPRFKYKSGRKKGMINLKALGIAYRKTSVYKLKKKRR